MLTTKPRPNEARYDEVLRQMSPADKLRKACELSELTRALFRAGLRDRHPEMSDRDLHSLFLEHMAQWQKLSS